jgi:hypothetical protein
MVNRLWIIAAVLSGLSLAQPVMAKERSIPLPRLKPSKLVPAVDTLEEAPPAQKVGKITFPSAPLFSGWSSKTLAAERAECAARLKGLDIAFEPLAPIGRDGGCGAAAPVKVTAISGVAIVPAAELTCDMAESLHAWLSTSAVPAARSLMKKRLVKINNASAYVCRRRNNSRGGKLSEHGKANALDIATLGFEDGSNISIKGDWSGLKQMIGLSKQGAFLRQVRRDACIRFTTVLGPGSDPYHGDHFHVDVARRKNGYRICK